MQLRVVRKLKRGNSTGHEPTTACAAAGRCRGGDDRHRTRSSVDSVTLMKGRRELVIRHGADTYRLRITASNKLILTK